jgi:hypothetical protein
MVGLVVVSLLTRCAGLPRGKLDQSFVGSDGRLFALACVPASAGGTAKPATTSVSTAARVTPPVIGPSRAYRPASIARARGCPHCGV